MKGCYSAQMYLLGQLGCDSSDLTLIWFWGPGEEGGHPLASLQVNRSGQEKGSGARVGVDERYGGRALPEEVGCEEGGAAGRSGDEDGDPCGHPDTEVMLTPETGLGSKRTTVRNSRKRNPAPWWGLRKI